MGEIQQPNIAMQHYELMLLIAGSVDSAQLPTLYQRVQQYLQEAGATITTQADLERRRLAYKIRQQVYGYYHLWQFDVQATALMNIDQKLRLDNDILRYLLVKAPVQTAEHIQTMVAGEKYKIHKAQPADAAAKTSVTALTEEEKMFAQAPVAKATEDTESSKVSIEELDKKLDAILEDTDIASKL